MSEQYRFMRYYLPGALFLAYLIVFVVLNLPADTIESLDWLKILGVLLGALGASPIVGYLIYAFYNEVIYENLAKWMKIRRALKYLEDLTFVEENVRARYQKQLKSFLKKKEFLDLVYHSTLVKSNKEKSIRIGAEILGTLKGHLSNFAARIICGVLVPVLLIPAWLLTKTMLKCMFDISFAPEHACIPLVRWYIVGIIILSLILFFGSWRVLLEAYQLEEYFIKAKEEVVKELLEKEFSS